MTTYYAQGSPQTDLSRDDLQAALVQTFRRLEPRKRVLALPPDYTRANSMAGPLTCLVYEYFGDRLVDVMPALGTHFAMPDWQRERMFPGVPQERFRVHDWRNGVVTIGQVPADFVTAATEGIWRKPWPAQLNRLVWEGRHDLILSIGQVVPHEVVGMANYNKNIFVGTGGSAGINESHFIGAAYGMERMMGRADTPLRRILNYAQEHFCRHLPLLFLLTVIGPRDDSEGDCPDFCGRRPQKWDCPLSPPAGGSPAKSAPSAAPAPLSSSLAVRGLFIGDDVDCFQKAADLSVKVNFTVLDEARRKWSSISIPRSSTAPGSATRPSTARAWPWPTPANSWCSPPALARSAKTPTSTP